MEVERAPKGPNVPVEGMLKYIANQRELKQKKSASRSHMWYVLPETEISWTSIVGMPPSKERIGSLEESKNAPMKIVISSCSSKGW